MSARQPIQVTTFSSESNEYYTPPEYIDLVRRALKTEKIGLDPASCKFANDNFVEAEWYFDKVMDGLSRPWGGNIKYGDSTCFLNPPYGKIGNKSSQGVWAEKLIREYKMGYVSRAILLVRSALGYSWFEDLFEEWPVCFARERIRFLGIDGKSKGPAKQGAAFFYFGPGARHFDSIFSDIGRVIMPVLPWTVCTKSLCESRRYFRGWEAADD